MEPKTRVSITDIESNGEAYVLIQQYIEFNDQEVSLGNHRVPLKPGQFDEAKEVLPDNQYAAVVALWTPEVIAAWEQKRLQNIPK